MGKILIDGVGRGVDGEYEFDHTTFKQREYHLIKTVAGVRALEIEEALNAGDLDMVVAFAKIALERAGKGDVPLDVLWEADVGQLTWDPGDAEDDEELVDLPPAQEPASSESDSGHTASG